MTLVEMLVAMTLTLLLMGAVAQVFGMLGQGVNGSRSIAELNDRMRAAAYRLQQDLTGVTVDPVPPVRAELDSGYLEIIEGPLSDASNLLTVGPPSDNRLVGDVDDVLLFTTQSSGEMFAGQADTSVASVTGSIVRSPFAEVIWFCRPTANSADPATFTLYRRQRIVTAQPGTPPFVDLTAGAPSRNSAGGVANTLAWTNLSAMYAATDVSIRKQGNVAMPNSLGDLSRRENRFLHNGAAFSEFPHPLYNYDPANHTFDNNVSRFGEDIVLTNIVAFDVRIWDPASQFRSIAAAATTTVPRYVVLPGDPGYTNVTSGTIPVFGAYADLGTSASFSGSGQPILRNTPGVTFTYPTYDTWSTAYESNGIDDDNDGIVDNGTNGLDDNANGAIDEPEESETVPPYATRLYGIEVRIRCYEPSSRQLRQITILKGF